MEKASHEVTVNNQSEFNPSTIVSNGASLHQLKPGLWSRKKKFYAVSRIEVEL